MPREYTSVTTYLDEAGALVVMDASGEIREDGFDVTAELSRLRDEGWQLVEINTSETVVVEDGRQETMVMSSYLLQRT